MTITTIQFPHDDFVGKILFMFYLKKKKKLYLTLPHQLLHRRHHGGGHGSSRCEERATWDTCSVLTASVWCTAGRSPPVGPWTY